MPTFLINYFNSYINAIQILPIFKSMETNIQT